MNIWHCWPPLTPLYKSCLFPPPCCLQEVSAFGENGEGDDLDVWAVQCDSDFWERDEDVRFKHVGTNVYLSVTGEQYGHPIRGQREVHGMKSSNHNNWWRSMEGVFIQPSQEPIRHDELWSDLLTRSTWRPVLLLTWTKGVNDLEYFTDSTLSIWSTQGVFKRARSLLFVV